MSAIVLPRILILADIIAFLEDRNCNELSVLSRPFVLAITGF
jgi:hypothetical protein